MRIPGLLAAVFLYAAVLSAQDKTIVAVLDLVPQNFSAAEAGVVSEQLRVELGKSGEFRLIERSQMESILKEQGFQQSGCTDDACAVEMGQLLGVKSLIVGSLGQAGSYTMMTLRMLDVGTGEVKCTESSKTKGGIDAVIETGVSAIVKNLVKQYRALSIPVDKSSVAEAEPAAVSVSANANDSLKSTNKPADAPRKKHRGAAIGIVAGTVVVVGAVAAVLVLGKKDSSGEDPVQTTPVEINLP